MLTYSDIEKVHLEISSRCNAACPDCPRNLRGVDVEGLFDERDMRLSEVQKLFPPEFIQRLTDVTINGNHGDFVTARDGLRIVEYIRECNPDTRIRIGTNASAQPKIWAELGRIPNLEIIFRIDGLADTHSIYRQDTDFDTVISNAQSFIQSGGYAIWAMILFDHNRHQIDEARAMSERLGFAAFQLVDAGRDNMVVFDRQKNYKGVIGKPVRIVKDWKILQEEFEGAKKYGVQDHQTYYAQAPKRKINCRVKGVNEVYVQSNGQVYPCCWLGFSPDHNFVRVGNDQIRAISAGNNALDHGLEAAIVWFDTVEKSWGLPSVKDGQLWGCHQTCGFDINAT